MGVSEVRMWSRKVEEPITATGAFGRLGCQRGSFWIDRALGGRASFMGSSPVAQLWIDASGQAWREETGRIRREGTDSLEAAAAFVRDAPSSQPGSAPRIVGFLSYGAGPLFEGRFIAHRDNQSPVPLAWFGRYDAVLRLEQTFPGASEEVRALVEADDEPAGKRLLHALRSQPDTSPIPDGTARLIDAPSWDEYAEAVGRTIEYIASGDIYQANLARRFCVESAEEPLDIYLRLRSIQAVPHGFFLDCGKFAVLSNSPERFLQVRGRRIRTEPIKGTRRRASQSDEDRRSAGRLREDPKERAEHVMIVDLERNDLGRICETGSVTVPSLLRVESFQTVHHLVSSVEGRLREGIGLEDVLRATFPGGSITGAPKIRASEVIAELEPRARGLYTGALMWFRTEDDFDSSIAIRTTVAHEGLFEHFAGSGLVADSDPRREYAECWLKARPFLESLLGAETAREATASARAATLASPKPTRRAAGANS
jgi:para-aminobenzoate synthetase component 1